MPILDTALLFATADASDKFHYDSSSRLAEADADSQVGTFALVEFDLVLRSRGSTVEQRSDLFVLLLKEYPRLAIHPISPSTLAIAAQMESRFKLDYFDALLASESMEHDGSIVSSDRAFDAIPGLKRIPLNANGKR